MNSYQKELLDEIEELKSERRKIVSQHTRKNGIKAATKQVDRRLKQLARDLAQPEYIERLQKTVLQDDPGGRSRSPAFGKWSNHERS